MTAVQEESTAVEPAAVEEAAMALEEAREKQVSWQELPAVGCCRRRPSTAAGRRRKQHRSAGRSIAGVRATPQVSHRS
jgi:hypothetical protein